MNEKTGVDVAAALQEAANALCTKEHVVLSIKVNGARARFAELLEAAKAVNAWPATDKFLYELIDTLRKRADACTAPATPKET